MRNFTNNEYWFCNVSINSSGKIVQNIKPQRVWATKYSWCSIQLYNNPNYRSANIIEIRLNGSKQRTLNITQDNCSNDYLNNPYYYKNYLSNSYEEACKKYNERIDYCINTLKNEIKKIHDCRTSIITGISKRDPNEEIIPIDNLKVDNKTVYWFVSFLGELNGYSHRGYGGRYSTTTPIPVVLTASGKNSFNIQRHKGYGYYYILYRLPGRKTIYWKTPEINDRETWKNNLFMTYSSAANVLNKTYLSETDKLIDEIKTRVKALEELKITTF